MRLNEFEIWGEGGVRDNFSLIFDLKINNL